MKPSREIRNAVLGWYLDLAKNDTDAVAEMFSLSDDVVFIGTDPNEVWTGGANVRAIIRRQMEQVGKVNINPGEITAFEEGIVGWATNSGTMGFSDDTGQPSRRICLPSRRWWLEDRDESLLPRALQPRGARP